MTKFIGEMIEASADRKAELLKSHPFREFWRTMAGGNYYYCFNCHELCPVERQWKWRKYAERSIEARSLFRPTGTSIFEKLQARGQDKQAIASTARRPCSYRIIYYRYRCLPLSLLQLVAWLDK